MLLAILFNWAYSPLQVLENTCKQRHTAPDRCGFFTSVLSPMGGYRLSVRLAAWLFTRFQIPAHPIRLKTSLVGLTNLKQETIMSTHARTTIKHAFFSYSSANQNTLFSVNANVPFEQLLEQTQCFLKSSLRTMEDAAMQMDASQNIWGAVYLTEMSLALLTACVEAINKEQQS